MADYSMSSKSQVYVHVPPAYTDSDKFVAALSAAEHKPQARENGRSPITVSLLSPYQDAHAASPKHHESAILRGREILPAAELAQPKDEGGSYFFNCCSRSRFHDDDTLGEHAVVLERPIEVRELFPLVHPDMRISLSVAIEDTLCPSFMRSEFPPFDNSSENTPRWHCGDLEADCFGWTCPPENPSYSSDFGACEELLNLSIKDNKQKTKNKKFTKEEDDKLKELVKTYGEGAWSKIAEKMEGRNRKQVRDRYENFLKEDPKTHDFSPEEDAVILKTINEYGKKWGYIARSLPGRTPLQIKARYYSKLKGSEISSDPSETKARTLSVESNCAVPSNTTSSPMTYPIELPKVPSKDIGEKEEQKKLATEEKTADKHLELLKEQHSRLKGALQTVANVIGKLKKVSENVQKPY